MTSMRYIHKKTGNMYYVIYDNVIDCNNNRTVETVNIVYQDSKGNIFVRESLEFHEKFVRKED